MTCNMKSAPEAFAGDTFIAAGDTETHALPGFKGPRSVVFAGLFATDSSDTALLADAMEKILLTDNSVVARKESSLALGTGFRCGFLGVLHMEVFIQRLLQEYDLEVIATAPTVPYQVEQQEKVFSFLFSISDKKVTDHKGVVTTISSASDFPNEGDFRSVAEPIVLATIVVPAEYEFPIFFFFEN